MCFNCIVAIERSTPPILGRESPRAYRAFLAYLELPDESRSIRAAFRAAGDAVGGGLTSWTGWARRNNWEARAKEFRPAPGEALEDSFEASARRLLEAGDRLIARNPEAAGRIIKTALDVWRGTRTAQITQGGRPSASVATTGVGAALDAVRSVIDQV